jgi:hypothetical protein
MASDKNLGEFSFKAITITHIPGPAGSVLTQVNWERTATGFGAVFNTTRHQPRHTTERSPDEKRPPIAVSPDRGDSAVSRLRL